jgi:hypothetical protein
MPNRCDDGARYRSTVDGSSGFRDLIGGRIDKRTGSAVGIQTAPEIRRVPADLCFQERARPAINSPPRLPIMWPAWIR